jgi:hypothetical protein
VIRVGQLRGEGDLAVTITQRSPLGIWLAEAPGIRLWAPAAVMETMFPEVLAEPESTPADEGPALLAEARESEATS